MSSAAQAEIDSAGISPVERARADLEAAQQTVEHLRDQDHELFSLWQAKKADLAEARDVAGSHVIEAAAEGDLRAGIAAAGGTLALVAGEVQAIEGALETNRRRRYEAIAAVWKASAAVVRSREALLRDEAARHGAESDRRRRELEEFDGCTYEPSRPPANGGIVVRRVPRHWVLNRDADELAAEAMRLEATRVQDLGVIENGEGLDGLIEQLLVNPMMVGPSLPEVARRAEAAAEKELARRARVVATHADNYVAPDAPVVFRLVWERGVITECRAFSLTSDGLVAGSLAAGGLGLS